jgi:hypothetical protein
MSELSRSTLLTSDGHLATPIVTISPAANLFVRGVVSRVTSKRRLQSGAPRSFPPTFVE